MYRKTAAAPFNIDACKSGLSADSSITDLDDLRAKVNKHYYLREYRIHHDIIDESWWLKYFDKNVLARYKAACEMMESP